MRKDPNKIVSAMIALLLVACAAPALVAGPVAVKVAESASGGVTSYAYHLENGTEHAIVSLRIGYDEAAGEGQLRTVPLGWTVTDGLPASSSTAPFGWVARVVTTEESEGLDIEWSSDEGAHWDVPSGGTAVFSIQLPQAAPEYRSASFEAVLADGTKVSGAVEPFDTTPPVLTVTVTPATLWAPNLKMVPVEVTLVVSDDTDPSPVVRLVSIGANEPLEEADVQGAEVGTDDRSFSLRATRSGKSAEGRVYAITYSATDASGNSATTTVTVTVPHDQRR